MANTAQKPTVAAFPDPLAGFFKSVDLYWDPPQYCDAAVGMCNVLLWLEAVRGRFRASLCSCLHGVDEDPKQ